MQAKRSRFSWALAITVLAAYFAFILIIAFQPSLFAAPLGDDTVITWGIPIGVGVIVLSFLLTGVYVLRANKDFDRATQRIVDDALERANESST